MSMKILRAEVLTQLERGPSAALVQAVVAWFGAYKTWEAGDTIGKAFHDQRLTIRTYAPPGKQSKWDTVYADNQTKAGGRTTSWAGSPQDVSGAGVFARTHASNFAPGASRKYAVGLHDLSASLLDPEQDISVQLFHKLESINKESKLPTMDGAPVIFMPLPKEADIQLFHLLNARTKLWREEWPRLYELICIYRARMTRIKQAYEYDIGAGFAAQPRAKPEPGKPNVKFKYGVGEKIKVVGGPTVPIKTTPGVNDEATLKANALSYKRILRDSPTRGTYNEITISYRQHANRKFPQAALWNFARKEFNCFSIDGKGEHGTVIANRPAKER